MNAKQLYMTRTNIFCKYIYGGNKVNGVFLLEKKEINEKERKKERKKNKKNR